MTNWDNPTNIDPKLRKALEPVMDNKRKRPIITTGNALSTPPQFRDRGYVTTERRDYPDGITVLVMKGENKVSQVLAFDRYKGHGDLTASLTHPKYETRRFVPVTTKEGAKAITQALRAMRKKVAQS